MDHICLDPQDKLPPHPSDTSTKHPPPPTGQKSACGPPTTLRIISGTALRDPAELAIPRPHVEDNPSPISLLIPRVPFGTNENVLTSHVSSIYAPTRLMSFQGSLPLCVKELLDTRTKVWIHCSRKGDDIIVFGRLYLSHGVTCK